MRGTRGTARREDSLICAAIFSRLGFREKGGQAPPQQAGLRLEEILLEQEQRLFPDFPRKPGHGKSHESANMLIRKMMSLGVVRRTAHRQFCKGGCAREG